MSLVAKALIESKAIHIEPNKENFFTWTSGIRSPIYCDNRQLISYPEYRAQITKIFCEKIREHYPKIELIAGTATAGIPWAAWIANDLNLPMVYIRSKPKGHGLKSAIEGKALKGQKTLIIEDLISTGKSSIEALEHARQDGLEVLSILSIFNYGFKQSIENFKNADISFLSLCSLDELLDYAADSKIIDSDQLKFVKAWPSTIKN